MREEKLHNIQTKGQINPKAYKGKFFNDYVEVTCFITHVINKTKDLLSNC